MSEIMMLEGLFGAGASGTAGVEDKFFGAGDVEDKFFGRLPVPLPPMPPKKLPKSARIKILKAMRADMKVRARVHEKLMKKARTTLVRRIQRRNLAEVNGRLDKVRAELKALGVGDLNGFGSVEEQLFGFGTGHPDERVFDTMADDVDMAQGNTQAASYLTSSAFGASYRERARARAKRKVKAFIAKGKRIVGRLPPLPFLPPLPGMAPLPRKLRGRRWPKMGKTPIKPTAERVAKFKALIEKDIKLTGRSNPKLIATKRRRNEVMARGHAVAAKKIGNALNVEKAKIGSLKSAMNAASNVPQKAQIAAQLQDSERYSRALITKFAQHGVAAQNLQMSASVMAQAEKAPNPEVRAKVLAEAEAIEKVPQAIEIKGAGANAMPGVPEVSEFASDLGFAQAVVMTQGQVPDRKLNNLWGLGFARDYSRAATFLTASAFGEVSVENQIDAEGRPIPGALPEDDATVRFIENNLSLFGQFDESFAGGWWTRYKKRAKKRSGSVVADIAKAVTKKGGVKGAVKETVTSAASNLVEKGLTKGIEKIGDNPTDLAAEPLAPSEPGMGDTGSSSKKMLLWGGIAAVAVGGGYAAWRIYKKRRGY